MKREDARYYLQSSGFSEEQINTIEQAFMQEPCEDCISRQAVINNSWELTYPDSTSERVVSVKDIKQLPSVTPQEQKTGHWIREIGYDICSKCGSHTIAGRKYCPECGSYNVEGEKND